MSDTHKNSGSDEELNADSSPNVRHTQSHSWALNEYLQPSNLVAAASAVLAIIALGVSVRGCQLAHDANQLAKKQYREERQIILQGEFSENGDTVTLRSISEESTLLEGRVYFPREISKREWVIHPSDKVLHLTSAKFGLQEAIRKRIPPKPGVIQLSVDGKIPVLIHAYYASSGEAYQDSSLYLLGVEFVVGEDASSPPTVKFTGLTFLRRLEVDKTIDLKMLDEMLNSERGIWIPPRTPS